MLKDESEFRKNNKSKDGLDYWCRSCHKEYRHKQYEKHKDYYNEYRKAHYEEHLERCRKRTQKCKERLYSYKTACVKCNENRPYVIDFHHINPEEKLYEISDKMTHYSEERLSGEIKKCVCLCKNCHTEFHYLYGRNPKNPVEALTKYIGRNPYEV